MNSMVGHRQDEVAPRAAPDDALSILTFLEEFSDEIEDGFDMVTPEPHFRMALHLLRGHFEARVVTPTSVISASRVPYATANRRLKDMVAAGLIEQRPRTATGKSFSMHPSDRLLSQWMQMSGRVRRLCEQQFGRGGQGAESQD